MAPPPMPELFVKKTEKTVLQREIFIILPSTSSSGGIGRRAGFKIQYFRMCGFDSRLEYRNPLYLIDLEGFILILI